MTQPLPPSPVAQSAHELIGSAYIEKFTGPAEAAS